MRNTVVELHTSSPLIDLHADTFSSVDVPENFLKSNSSKHIDLPRMLDIKFKGELFSLFVHPSWGDGPKWRELALAQLNIMENTSTLSHGIFHIVTELDEVEEHAQKTNSVFSLVEIEGLHPLEGKIDSLIEFFARGVRVFTLTWNNSNDWATSCMDSDAAFKGITEEGLQAVKTINELGGIIDLSHSGERTFWDAMEKSDTPPICTHSCCKSLKDSSRNLTDVQIKAMIERQGIIGINFYPGFLGAEKGKVKISDIVRHIEHIIELGGEKVLALGSDFDGVQHLPSGMTNCGDLPFLTVELLERGFSHEMIRGILGSNFMDYLRRIDF